MYLFYIYHRDMKNPMRVPDPVGWNPTGKKLVRDTKWHGVMWKYTPKLQFIKKGRAAIHYYYEKYGPETELILTVYKKNNFTRQLELNYTGRINLMGLKITDNFAEANVEQTGFIQKLTNQQDVKINPLALADQEGNAMPVLAANNILLTSKVIKRQDTLNIPLSVGVGEFTGPNGTYYLQGSYQPNGSAEVSERVEYPTQISTLDPVAFQKYDYKMKEDGVYTFLIRPDLTLERYAGGPDTHDWDVTYYLTYGKPGDYTTIEVAHQFQGGQTFILFYGHELTQELTLAKGTEVYIYGRLILGSVSGDITFRLSYSTEALLSVLGYTTFPQTSAPMVLFHEAYERTIHSLTGKQNAFYSTLYGRIDTVIPYGQDGEGALRGFSNGKLVRGFPLADNPMQFSLSDLQKVGLAVDGAGIGIEIRGGREVAVAEKIGYFYNATRSAQFPFVRDIEKSVAEEYYYNELGNGYATWSNEEINNLDEFNAIREGTLPLTQTKKKLDLRCPFIGSGYTAEFVRRDNYSLSATKDNDRDADNFIFQLRRDDGSLVLENDEDFAELNNVISPETIINARLSPMRNLLRNGSLLRGGLWKLDDKFINITSTQGNTAFTSRLNTETELVNEKQIAVNKLSKAIWIPELYSFKTKLSRLEALSIEDNPYGFVEFAKDNKNWKRGYIIEMEPATTSELTTFKVLKANL